MDNFVPINEFMEIRKAVAADADAIAECLLLAMHAIVCQFTGSSRASLALAFMRHFTRQHHNQYSYQNCHVAVVGKRVVGAINLYDGAQLAELRRPVLAFIHTHYQPGYQPEDETGPGEIYIDTIGVAPAWQGRGIGTQLLRFVIDQYVHRQHRTLGLLVEESNAGAERLYCSLGFKVTDTKTVFGERMNHLQIAP